MNTFVLINFLITSVIFNSVICEEIFVQNNYNEINLYNIAGCTSKCLKNENTMVCLFIKIIILI